MNPTEAKPIHDAEGRRPSILSEAVEGKPEDSDKSLKMSRVWAMPNCNTFDIPPIAGFVQKYLQTSLVSIDPFARNKRWATHTNDINPNTSADLHLDAEDFLILLAKRGIKADLVLFDPPYSPRQISECYAGCFKEVTQRDTQGSALYSRVRSRISDILNPSGTVLSFGWNSNGMGKKLGFEIVEMLLVAHGGAHNDTICMAERRRYNGQSEMFLCGATPKYLTT